MSVDDGLEGAAVAMELGMKRAQVLLISVCYVVLVQCMDRVCRLKIQVLGLCVEGDALWEHIRHWIGWGGWELLLQYHGGHKRG